MRSSLCLHAHNCKHVTLYTMYVLASHCASAHTHVHSYMHACILRDVHASPHAHRLTPSCLFAHGYIFTNPRMANHAHTFGTLHSKGHMGVVSVPCSCLWGCRSRRGKEGPVCAPSFCPSMLHLMLVNYIKGTTRCLGCVSKKDRTA